MASNIVAIDKWNQVTRVSYVILVNGVLLEPLQQIAFPSGAQLQKYIESVPKNYNENFLLCGAKSSGTSTISFLSSPAIQSKQVPLILNQFILEITNPFYNDFLSAIQTSLIIVNPVFKQYSFTISVSSVLTSKLGIDNNNIGVYSNISSDQM